MGPTSKGRRGEGREERKEKEGREGILTMMKISYLRPWSEHLNFRLTDTV